LRKTARDGVLRYPCLSTHPQEVKSSGQLAPGPEMISTFQETTPWGKGVGKRYWHRRETTHVQVVRGLDPSLPPSFTSQVCWPTCPQPSNHFKCPRISPQGYRAKGTVGPMKLDHTCWSGPSLSTHPPSTSKVCWKNYPPALKSFQLPKKQPPWAQVEGQRAQRAKETAAP